MRRPLSDNGMHSGAPGMTARYVILLALVTLALALCAPQSLGGQAGPAASAPDPELEARVRQVSAELRCPVCQGLSLADSPSELSREMKDVVRAQLAAGKTPDEVKAYFVSKYGEWILLEPRARGLNLLVYALPLLLVIAGLGGVLYAARRWTTSGASPAAAASPIEHGTISTSGAHSQE